MLKVALIAPEIAWNTGNVGRSCVAADAELHLVAPLGFSLSERRLRRAGMDYWERLRLVQHSGVEEFLNALPAGADIHAFSAEATLGLWDAEIRPDSWLIFGSESSGLPEDLRARWKNRLVKIPMAASARSLNLSTAAAIAMFEARRPRAVLS